MTVLVPQREGIPLPETSPVSEPFWDACARHELIFQRCGDCDAAVFVPSLVCRQCTSRDLTWARSAGRGTLYSWSVVWRPQTPEYEVPYAPIIVEIDEGYRMLSNLVGCEAEDIEPHLRLRVAFRQVGALTLPYFTPEAAPRSRP
jgi:hypothetical protein